MVDEERFIGLSRTAGIHTRSAERAVKSSLNVGQDWLLYHIEPLGPTRTVDLFHEASRSLCERVELTCVQQVLTDERASHT